jgi:phospholipid/cholesterol/gamma-HCH transport system substrate-binding protein
MPEQSTKTPPPTQQEREQQEREQPARRDDLPVPKSRSREREVWVGLFVILGITMTMVALYTLTDAAFFRGRYIVSTVVPDAGGIRRGDPVQMLGVNIGRVHRFSFTERGVEVSLELEGEYPVPTDSTVELTSNSLLGGMVAEVHPGKSTERIEGGAVLPGTTQEGLMKAATNIADSTEVVLGRLETALSEEAARSVSRTAQSVERTAQTMEKSGTEARELLSELRALTGEQRKEIAGLTQSLRRSAAEIEEAAAKPELDQAIARLDTLTRNLESSTASLGRSSTSLETVLARLERGEGSLGRLTKDDALYVNLNEATVNLNRLLVDVRRNPKRYVDLSIF